MGRTKNKVSVTLITTSIFSMMISKISRQHLVIFRRNIEALAELLKCAFRILDPVQVVTSSGKGGGSQLWEDMKVSKLLGVPDLN